MESGVDFSVGILTHNAVSALRFALLEETVASLCVAFRHAPILVFDNGSVDGSDLSIEDRIGKFQGLLGLMTVSYRRSDGNVSPGAGRNALVGMLERFVEVGRKANPARRQVIVLSDDDMRWRPTASQGLAEFWMHAPEDVAILSGLLEPEYDWNAARGLVAAGSAKALWRDSAPAAAWSFPFERWAQIGPLREGPGDHGEDYDACLRVRGAGQRVAQMDLAEHLGADVSTLGNTAFGGGQPLDRAKWGI